LVSKSEESAAALRNRRVGACDLV